MQGKPIAKSGGEVLARFLRFANPKLPKHAQLSEALLAAIESGYWKPETRLPSEADLARLTPFSLGTVQRALRALVEDGILVRQQGSGTYVTGNRKAVNAPWHCRFYADDGKSFLPVYPKVVGRRRIKERGPWSECLQQEGDNIIRIDRRSSINDEFVVFSRFYLNADHFGSMMEKPVSELDGANFKTILDREFGLPVANIIQTVTVLWFPDAFCRACLVEKGTTGMFLQSVASTVRGRNVYYQEFFVPPSNRRMLLSDHYDPEAL